RRQLNAYKPVCDPMYGGPHSITLKEGFHFYLGRERSHRASGVGHEVNGSADIRCSSRPLISRTQRFAGRLAVLGYFLMSDVATKSKERTLLGKEGNAVAEYVSRCNEMEHLGRQEERDGHKQERHCDRLHRSAE